MMRLQNDGTFCYINCSANMLSWACAASARFRELLPGAWLAALAPLAQHVYRSSSLSPYDKDNAPLHLPSHPSWVPFFEGWPLGAQEDASEFLLHILHRIPLPLVEGILVMHNQAARLPETQRFVLLNVPVPEEVEEDSKSAACSLTYVLDRWARSGDTHADRNCFLLHPPTLLLIQLMRYSFRGEIMKNRIPIHIPEIVAAPCLVMGEFVTHSYRQVATILHHGEDPSHGHYTTILCDVHAGRWHLDDSNLPRALSRSDADALSMQDMYIVCLERV